MINSIENVSITKLIGFARRSLGLVILVSLPVVAMGTEKEEQTNTVVKNGQVIAKASVTQGLKNQISGLEEQIANVKNTIENKINGYEQINVNVANKILKLEGSETRSQLAIESLQKENNVLKEDDKNNKELIIQLQKDLVNIEKSQVNYTHAFNPDFPLKAACIIFFVDVLYSGYQGTFNYQNSFAFLVTVYYIATFTRDTFVLVKKEK